MAACFFPFFFIPSFLLAVKLLQTYLLVGNTLFSQAAKIAGAGAAASSEVERIPHHSGLVIFALGKPATAFSKKAAFIQKEINGRCGVNGVASAGQFSPSLCKAGKLTVGQAGLLCLREPHRLAPMVTTTKTQDGDPLFQSQGDMHSSAFGRTPPRTPRRVFPELE